MCVTDIPWRKYGVRINASRTNNSQVTNTIATGSIDLKFRNNGTENRNSVVSTNSFVFSPNADGVNEITTLTFYDQDIGEIYYLDLFFDENWDRFWTLNEISILITQNLTGNDIWHACNLSVIGSNEGELSYATVDVSVISSICHISSWSNSM